MSKPKLKLVESYGFYHLIIGSYENQSESHIPKHCPECITPGLWPIKVAK